MEEEEDGTSRRIVRGAVLEGRTGRVLGEWARREMESEGDVGVLLVLREIRCRAKVGVEEEEEEEEEDEEEVGG